MSVWSCVDRSSRGYVQQAKKTLHRKARSGEEHQGKADFADDEEISRPLSANRHAEVALSFLQRVTRARARCEQRREQAEEKTR